jgi:hypothetical protein
MSNPPLVPTKRQTQPAGGERKTVLCRIRPGRRLNSLPGRDLWACSGDHKKTPVSGILLDESVRCAYDEYTTNWLESRSTWKQTRDQLGGFSDRHQTVRSWRRVEGGEGLAPAHVPLRQRQPSPAVEIPSSPGSSRWHPWVGLGNAGPPGGAGRPMEAIVQNEANSGVSSLKSQVSSQRGPTASLLTSNFKLHTSDSSYNA